MPLPWESGPAKSRCDSGVFRLDFYSPTPTKSIDFIVDISQRRMDRVIVIRERFNTFLY
jgi:hypothetical protein